MSLILARKIGQRIFIGRDVCVTVYKTSRGSASLSILAPKEIEIHRGERAPEEFLSAIGMTAAEAASDAKAIEALQDRDAEKEAYLRKKWGAEYRR